MITHRQALPRDQKSSKEQVGSARQGYCHDHYSDSALDNLAQQQSAPKSQCEQPTRAGLTPALSRRAVALRLP